jgi:putative phosphoribosyl transferase
MADPDSPVHRRVAISLGEREPLPGDLAVPPNATGLVIFAHGSGSTRHSPHNRQIARALNRRGLGTLLLDLLSLDEERVKRNVFDVPLLGNRLLAATAWAGRQPELAHLPIAYFGVSTGAGAALWAAARAGERVRAVVSRGGRPDLAGLRLEEVRAPVLIIVGNADGVVLELNRRALARLRCPAELAVVERATHRFDEPAAVAEVARIAGDWLAVQLTRPAASAASRPDVAALE